MLVTYSVQLVSHVVIENRSIHSNRTVKYSVACVIWTSWNQPKVSWLSRLKGLSIMLMSFFKINIHVNRPTMHVQPVIITYSNRAVIYVSKMIFRQDNEMQLLRRCIAQYNMCLNKCTCIDRYVNEQLSLIYISTHNYA